MPEFQKFRERYRDDPHVAVLTINNDTNLDDVRAQLSEARATNVQLQEQVVAVSVDFEDQVAKYDELLRRVSQLEFGPLPIELEIALDQLAAAYPELLSFDAAHGLLRFSSDFTFDLGSAELRTDAEATLVTLADILNSDDASSFELRLIGHTDNVPVERPSTRQRHPTNVHLSVHRAISVRDLLVAAGVEAARIQVAGDILDFDDFFTANDALVFDEKALEKRLRKPPDAADLLKGFRERLATAETFDAPALEDLLKAYVEERDVKIGQIIHALRVAVTGKAIGFGMFETLALVGRERCLARIDRALSLL